MSKKNTNKGGIEAQRDVWHEALDGLDDCEALLIRSKLLTGGPLMLALEQINDIRDALLQVRPRK